MNDEERGVALEVMEAAVSSALFALNGKSISEEVLINLLSNTVRSIVTNVISAATDSRDFDKIESSIMYKKIVHLVGLLLQETAKPEDRFTYMKSFKKKMTEKES